MEAFTATADPVTINSPTPKPPSKSFRKLFLLLLLVTFIFAISTAYILISGKNPQVVSTTPPLQTSIENPFAADATSQNPFADAATTQDTTTVNPFTDRTSENFFDQFQDQTTQTSTTTNQNPF